MIVTLLLQLDII